MGQKRPNAWGLYDMHGNVEEWCWDGYEADYYSKKPPAADPLGPSQTASRVNRCGCWRLRREAAGRRSASGTRPGTGPPSWGSTSSEPSPVREWLQPISRRRPIPRPRRHRSRGGLAGPAHARPLLGYR